MHRVEIKTKSGKKMLYGVFENYEDAIKAYNSLWKYGSSSIETEEIEEIILTSYARGK